MHVNNNIAGACTYVRHREGNAAVAPTRGDHGEAIPEHKTGALGRPKISPSDGHRRWDWAYSDRSPIRRERLDAWPRRKRRTVAGQTCYCHHYVSGRGPNRDRNTKLRITPTAGCTGHTVERYGAAPL